ncbi:lysine-rich arabinogalactan protein 19-like [Zingiber officinale]|uniref:lysine-rich arabinogalactan protein 19-like n=1 Tax=Zingiber officinale TaxID=94328 RepID=UPI001C4B126A|nr:lysine-rich arabinogalactan protein 19-like [Zingiber officinale]
MSARLPLQIPDPVFLAEPHLLSDLPPLLVPFVPRLHVHPGLPPLFVPGPRLQPGHSPRCLFNLLILPDQPLARVVATVEDQPTFLTPALPSEKLLRRLVGHILAPDRIPDLGPSTVPPPPAATTTSPLPPIATTSPIPSQADAPPAPPEAPTEPLLAQPSTS